MPRPSSRDIPALAEIIIYLGDRIRTLEAELAVECEYSKELEELVPRVVSIDPDAEASRPGERGCHSCPVATSR